MTATSTRQPTAFCSIIARERGLDPIGLVVPRDFFLVAEAPLPWERAPFESADLPPTVAALVRRLTKGGVGTPPIRLRPMLIAPDPRYAAPGHRRVIALHRPTINPNAPFAPSVSLEHGFGRLERREYLVPDEEVGALCEALFLDPAALPRFARWRQATEGCATSSSARTARSMPPARGSAHRSGGTSPRMPMPRVARCGPAHFGAHVCAPTLVDLPEGRYWGFLDHDEASILGERRGDLGRLRGCYRGWTGHDDPWRNAIEREAMLREGWD